MKALQRLATLCLSQNNLMRESIIDGIYRVMGEHKSIYLPHNLTCSEDESGDMVFYEDDAELDAKTAYEKMETIVIVDDTFCGIYRAVKYNDVVWFDYVDEHGRMNTFDINALALAHTEVLADLAIAIANGIPED